MINMYLHELQQVPKKSTFQAKSCVAGGVYNGKSKADIKEDKFSGWMDRSAC